MLDIFLAQRIYQLNYIHSNDNINVGNLDHVVVEYNIAQNMKVEAGISCWLYNPYIYQRKNVDIYQIF